MAKSKLLALGPEVIGEKNWSPFATRVRGELLRLAPEARVLGLVDVGCLRQGFSEPDEPAHPGRNQVALGWVSGEDRIRSPTPRG